METVSQTTRSCFTTVPRRTSQVAIQTGDGFTFSQELARGYDPTIPDITTNGGAIMRLSDSTTFVPGTNEYYYEIQSKPQGLISTTSGYVLPGTLVPTPDVSYGSSSGYYFGYWTINGVRQAGVTGASPTAVTLLMTNDETAVAVFFLPGDSTSFGLQDWYQWFWFGNLNQTPASDPTSDGFTIADDIARDYSPVVANVTINGGAIMRLSGLTTFNLSLYPTILITISNGQVVISWSVGGVLQSSTNVNGPYTDVINAPDPYIITPTADQMFFRVEY